MMFSEKYNKVITGLISGLILPFLIGLIIYLFSAAPQSLNSYLDIIADSDIETHAISLCVFPNLLIFLAFNRFDMLNASRGVLFMTIIWAFLVFGIKLF